MIPDERKIPVPCSLCGEDIIEWNGTPFCDAVCAEAAEHLSDERKEPTEEEAADMAAMWEAQLDSDEEGVRDLDGDALASAGFGTDEDYGYNGDDGTDWDESLHDADMDFFGSEEF